MHISLGLEDGLICDASDFAASGIFPIAEGLVTSNLNHRSFFSQ
jgi:hypothetical protein